MDQYQNYNRNSQYTLNYEYSFDNNNYCSPMLTSTYCQHSSEFFYHPIHNKNCIHSGIKFKFLLRSIRHTIFFLNYYSVESTIVPKDFDYGLIRRHRCFKKNELKLLHQVYNRETHPNLQVLEQLADQLEAPLEKVQVE